MFLAVKYLVTAAVVVLVSEIARRNAQLGALIAALPLVSLLVLAAAGVAAWQLGYLPL